MKVNDFRLKSILYLVCVCVYVYKNGLSSNVTSNVTCDVHVHTVIKRQMYIAKEPEMELMH